MKRALLAGFALALAALPAAAQEEEYRPTWNLYVESDIATLNYAIAESDDAGPTLMCNRRGGRNTNPGQLNVYVFTSNRVSGRTAPLQLRSGSVTLDLRAAVEVNEDSGGSELIARIPLTAPVLAEFARTGRITFTGAGESETPPQVETAKVNQLLAACRR